MLRLGAVNQESTRPVARETKTGNLDYINFVFIFKDRCNKIKI